MKPNQSLVITLVCVTFYIMGLWFVYDVQMPEILGYLGGVLSFGKAVPQIYENYQRRKTDDLSFGGTFLGISSNLVYVIYASIKDPMDHPLLRSCLASAVMYGILLMQKHWYDQRPLVSGSHLVKAEPPVSPLPRHIGSMY